MMARRLAWKFMPSNQNPGAGVRPRKNLWINSDQTSDNRTPIFNLRDDLVSNPLKQPQHQEAATKTIPRKIMDQLEIYCEKTTLHGLRYVGDTSLSLGERIFWLVSFTIAIGFAAYYISNIYQKWNSSPVIISFSPFDADISTIPFPAITICNMNQAKRSEAERILREGSPVERKLLNDFCNGNNSFDQNEVTSWDALRNFLVRVGQSCSDILKVCEWRNDKINCESAFNNDLTDEGLCCSFNRLPPEMVFRNARDIAILNQTYPGNVYDWNPERGFTEKDTGDETIIPRRPLGAGAHLGLTLIMDAQVDNYYCSSTHSVGFKVLLANPTETPKMADFAFFLSPGMETRISIMPVIREATASLRDIAIDKRQCYFSNERPLRYYRKYTIDNCKLECQSNYTYQQCNCIPYFLPSDFSMKFCDMPFNECIEQAKANIELTIGKANSCYCLPNCHRVIYETSKSFAKLSEGISDTLTNVSKDYFIKNMVIVQFLFGESKFSKLVKSELHDFTDLLSSIGAFLSVFLGFSLLSLIECSYYLFALQLKAMSYTQRNCNLECQSNYTLQLCTCVPYFLPKNYQTKTCGKADEICSNQAKEDMELSFGNGSSCHCLPGCFELNYNDKKSYSPLSNDVKVFDDQMGNISGEYFERNMAVVQFFFPTTKFTKLVKSELYGFTEILSNVGGLLGLCMGFSFLSFIELVYFVSLRLVCNYIRQSKGKKRRKPNLLFGETSNHYPFLR